MNIYEYCEAMNLELKAEFWPNVCIWAVSFDKEKVCQYLGNKSTGSIPRGEHHDIYVALDKFAEAISGMKIAFKKADDLVFTVPHLRLSTDE